MARRKTTYKRYNKPTEMVAVRVPTDLHVAIKERARASRVPKSRKIVELLMSALGRTEPETTGSESAFE